MKAFKSVVEYVQYYLKNTMNVTQSENILYFTTLMDLRSSNTEMMFHSTVFVIEEASIGQSNVIFVLKIKLLCSLKTSPNLCLFIIILSMEFS